MESLIDWWRLIVINVNLSFLVNQFPLSRVSIKLLAITAINSLKYVAIINFTFQYLFNFHLKRNESSIAKFHVWHNLRKFPSCPRGKFLIVKKCLHKLMTTYWWFVMWVCYVPWTQCVIFKSFTFLVSQKFNFQFFIFLIKSCWFLKSKEAFIHFSFRMIHIYIFVLKWPKATPTHYIAHSSKHIIPESREGRTA